MKNWNFAMMFGSNESFERGKCSGKYIWANISQEKHIITPQKIVPSRIEAKYANLSLCKVGWGLGQPPNPCLLFL